MKQLCYVVTIPAAVHAFLRGHIQMTAQKYQVTVICNSVDKHLLEGLNARLIFLPIERKPAPCKDMLVLFQLFWLFRRKRFDIVHSHLPKTALLGMLAAWLAGVPIRINTFHGEVWATRKGLQRAVLKLFDRWIGLLATDVLTVSPSQRQFLIDERILPLGKAKLIGAGSICGVDPLRFRPDAALRKQVRLELNIADDAVLILFVGRLNRDKGVLELAAAFEMIAKESFNADLLLVGAEEDVPFRRMQEICSVGCSRLHYLKFTTTPERYMAAADVFCLPSHREGFGMTIIEAAGCGIPAVATRIYGITDAVADGKTGLLFTSGNVTELKQALSQLITNANFRIDMGVAAYARVLDQFSSEKIAYETAAFYELLLEKN